jgi:hypothetical protein
MQTRPCGIKPSALQTFIKAICLVREQIFKARNNIQFPDCIVFFMMEEYIMLDCGRKGTEEKKKKEIDYDHYIILKWLNVSPLASSRGKRDSSMLDIYIRALISDHARFHSAAKRPAAQIAVDYGPLNVTHRRRRVRFHMLVDEGSVY